MCGRGGGSARIHRGVVADSYCARQRAQRGRARRRARETQKLGGVACSRGGAGRGVGKFRSAQGADGHAPECVRSGCSQRAESGQLIWLPTAHQPLRRRANRCRPTARRQPKFSHGLLLPQLRPNSLAFGKIQNQQTPGGEKASAPAVTSQSPAAVADIRPEARTDNATTQNFGAAAMKVAAAPMNGRVAGAASSVRCRVVLR